MKIECKQFFKEQPLLRKFLYFLLVLNAVLFAMVISNYFEIRALKEIILKETKIQEKELIEIIEEIEKNQTR